MSTLHENYWGQGSWASQTVITLTGTLDASLMPNITFGPANPSCDATPNATGYVVSCGNGFNEGAAQTGTGRSDKIVLSADTADSGIECERLFETADGYLHIQNNQAAYDTARYAIEHCANQNDLQPWLNFSIADYAVYNLYRPTYDSILWQVHREWLKSVLYLNTTDFHYYCSDVGAIMNSMRYFPGRGNDFNGALAIFKYIIDSGKCPKLFFSDSLWASSRNAEYQLYQDTVKDSLKTPFDTTLPTIDELGLQILRGPQFGDVAVSPSTVDHDAIVTLVAKENPFTNEAVLRYTLRSTAALRLEIFDALGKRMYSDAIGFRGAGEYTSAVPAIGWSRGTYYARLSSLTGGVLTVKLVKNE